MIQWNIKSLEDDPNKPPRKNPLLLMNRVLKKLVASERTSELNMGYIGMISYESLIKSKSDPNHKYPIRYQRETNQFFDLTKDRSLEFNENFVNFLNKPTNLLEENDHEVNIRVGNLVEIYFCVGN